MRSRDAARRASRFWMVVQPGRATAWRSPLRPSISSITVPQGIVIQKPRKRCREADDR